MTKPRPPLKVGDRVSVKGYTSAGTYCVNAYGVVHRVLQLRADRIEVKLKSGSIEMVHRGQCRRLKPRKKPAPDAGKATREWELVGQRGGVMAIREGEALRWQESVRVCELLPGHAVVSRETLDEIVRALENAKAHLECNSRGKEPYYGNTIWRISCALEACAALGLDKGEEGKK